MYIRNPKVVKPKEADTAGWEEGTVGSQAETCNVPHMGECWVPGLATLRKTGNFGAQGITSETVGETYRS